MFELLGFNKRTVLLAIIGLALLIRLLALYEYGLSLTIESDDKGYVSSAKTLIETGTLTYHSEDEPTVHIMPGQTFLLAFIFLIFGSGDIGIYAAKIAMILIGTSAAFVLFAMGVSLGNEKAGMIAAFLYAVFIPLVLTNNLLLTETPFMFFMLSMLYFSIRLANTHRMRDFYLLMAAYLLAIMFKATIAMFPVVLLIYFLLKKYPVRLAMKQLMIAILIVLIVLGPWWVRNYMQFNEFIPLTGGAGNPLLLGSYQGHGYKYGDSYKDVLEKINRENPGLNALGKMKLQEEVAKKRIKVWLNHDSESFWDSYIRIKTKSQWESHFYWIEIFHISTESVQTVHLVILFLFIVSVLFIPFSNNRREYFFMLLIILYFTVLNDIYYAYSRYNQPLTPILFLFIGMMAAKLFSKQESINI